ncbi:hypothetical protein BG011_009932 [Mortierella polycephala]|uniref:FAD-binding domain-containing protein n=1 Tax=Mortierella polycephala TaxID=41804 RepID=A0A9P6TWB4_9FUNG|nr:hypothetical protein BG011_009932 [Mortierella polycephala]
MRRAKVGANKRSTENKVLGAVDQYQTIHSEYLIAANGGISVVRHRLTISFHGRTRSNSIILYYGDVKSSVPLDHLSMISGGNGRIIITLPLTGTRIRIMFDNGAITTEEYRTQKLEDLTLPKFQEMLNATVAPLKIELLKRCGSCAFARWRSRDEYGVPGRLQPDLKDRARAQRVSLESILDTYETERTKVADEVIKLSTSILRVSKEQDIFGRILKRLTFLALSCILPFMSQGPPVSMLRIRCYENDINKRHISQDVPGEEYRVGVRARDGTLAVFETENGFISKGDSTLRLHDLLVGPGIFHILVFTSDMLTKINVATAIKGIQAATSNSVAKQCAEHLVRWRASCTSKPIENLFMIHVVCTSTRSLGALTSLSTKTTGEFNVYLYQEGVVHRRYGVSAKGDP